MPDADPSFLIAFFLRWASRRLGEPQFVPKLNEALRNHAWNGGQLLYHTFGKDIEELWKEYKEEMES